MEMLIIVAFVSIGVIVFTAGVVKMISRFRKGVEAVGGLEGLKAMQLRMMEEKPAVALPVVTPVSKSNTARTLSLIFTFSLLLSCGVAGFFQARAIRETRLLEAEGTVTSATVVAKKITENDDGDETYYVTYAFGASSPEAETQHVQRKESVPYAVFVQAEEGGSIDVIYAPSDPKVARVMAGYKPGRVNYLAGIIGAIVGIVDLSLLMAFLPSYRKAVRLDTEGMMATTTILDLHESSDSDGTTYYVAYALPDGQRIRHSIKSAIYKQLHVGDSVTIVYLADNPKVFRPEWSYLEWN